MSTLYYIKFSCNLIAKHPTGQPETYYTLMQANNS